MNIEYIEDGRQVSTNLSCHLEPCAPKGATLAYLNMIVYMDVVPKLVISFQPGSHQMARISSSKIDIFFVCMRTTVQDVSMLRYDKFFMLHYTIKSLDYIELKL